MRPLETGLRVCVNEHGEKIMTTKYKIIGGFIFMIVLVGGVAALSYHELDRSIRSFGEFRRNAHVNTLSSTIAAKLLTSTSQTYSFLQNPAKEKIDTALKAVDELVALSKQGEALTRVPARKTAFQALQGKTASLKTHKIAVRDSVLAFRGEYDKVHGNFDNMAKALVSLGKFTHQADNTGALPALTKIWNDFMHSVTWLERFAESGTLDDRSTALEHIYNLHTSLATFEDTFQSRDEKEFFNELLYAQKSLLAAAETMMIHSSDMMKALHAMRKIEAEITASVDVMIAETDSGMLTIGELLDQEGEEAKNFMVLLSIAGILAGAALAALIIIGLVRVLRDVSAFATAVARGDFSYNVKTREKGEIGTMVQSMQTIPAVLTQLVHEADSLSNKILVGNYNQRLNADAFPGEYQTLSQSINTVSKAYTQAIDAIPLAIIACDLDYRIIYINDATKAVLGGDKTGEFCHAMFMSPVCQTPHCFAHCARTSGQPHVGETNVAPIGVHAEISVTAIPLNDRAGVMQGHLEICTDITEMKNKQRTMLQLTEQAAEISTRMASASEELSAQVEQVTLGAETQRERVESTAHSIAEMNESVLEVAHSAGQASTQSAHTRQRAEDGAGLVRQVISSISTVNSISHVLLANMEDLGKQTESIGGVMNVISDIADQTNLLALNAAIEAARAGDAGRGFAVVADEVRKLAEKTMHATQEVGARIHAVQQSARVNIDEVGRAAASVSEATSLANASGEALAQIVDLASASSGIVTSIAAAAEKQSATSAEINKAVEEINQIVSETSKDMAQSSNAVQELSLMAQELRSVMREIE